MNTFIGLKKLWYGDVLNSAPAYNDMATLVAGMTEVTNVHQDTWSYEEADPETTEYVNELTGQNYYVDMTKQSIPTISFTLGEYQFQQKADLQGGTVILESTLPVGWKKPTEMNVVYKAIVALSKTDTYIIFPKAQITGKGDVQEKNIGLGVSALCCETGNSSIAPEYWIKKKLSSTVTLSLSHATGSNNAETVATGGSYANTLTAGEGYHFGSSGTGTRLYCTVTMNGTNVTTTAFNETTGAVSISNVLGDIAITVSTEAPAASS